MTKNFSVYFYIYNDTNLTLNYLGRDFDEHTKWEVAPPASIPPATQAPNAATAQARNKRNLEGSDATMAYSVAFENGARSYVILNGADPFRHENNASCIIEQKVDEQQVPPNYLAAYGRIAVPDIVAAKLEGSLQYYSGTGTPVWSRKVPKKGHPFSILLTVSLVDEYLNWMSDEVIASNQPLLDQPLSNLCLPASHDSGTYGLTNHLAPELYDLPAWIPKIYRPFGGDANCDDLPPWLRTLLRSYQRERSQRPSRR